MLFRTLLTFVAACITLLAMAQRIEFETTTVEYVKLVRDGGFQEPGTFTPLNDRIIFDVNNRTMELPQLGRLDGVEAMIRDGSWIQERALLYTYKALLPSGTPVTVRFEPSDDLPGTTLISVAEPREGVMWVYTARVESREY